MRVKLASSPGYGARLNEDYVGTVPGAVVLLDGAGIPGAEEVCLHGVRWYAQTLGITMLGLLTADPVWPLAEVLAQALQHVADQHRFTCDLEDPRSPQAAVAAARVHDDAIDMLVLADAFIVIEPSSGAPEVLTDPREVDVRRECLSLLNGVPEGTPEHAQTLAQVVTDFRARRNVCGGYWIAKHEPAAAGQAVITRRSLHDVRSVSLISNGVSRLIDPYAVTTWPVLVRDLRTLGPEGLLRQLRDIERKLLNDGGHSALPAPDDATVAYCLPSCKQFRLDRWTESEQWLRP